MFERISRSIDLVKTSWRILMEEKRLLAFPILSGIVTLIVIATFILPLILSKGALSLTTNTVTGIVLLFLFYLVSSCVVVFFNVGLITCVHAKLQGRTMTIGEGLAAAGKHVIPILGWAIISATVGVLLRLVEDRAGTVGEIIGATVGGVWSLITMFVVPVLVFEERGVFDAIQGSLGLFKKTWGESAVGSLSIGLIFFVIGIVGFVLAFATLMLNNTSVFIAAIALYIVLVAVLAILSSAMQGIFVVALYIYATTGRVPSAFNRELIEGAFAPRSPGNRSYSGNI